MAKYFLQADVGSAAGCGLCGFDADNAGTICAGSERTRSYVPVRKYYKSKPRQHNPLSQQKEFRAIKNAIVQEAERLRLPSEYLLNSTVRLFRQMGQIFRDNAAPPSNPMGICVDSKRRKKLMQKRLAMGHKQDDHEQAIGRIWRRKAVALMRYRRPRA